MPSFAINVEGAVCTACQPARVWPSNKGRQEDAVAGLVGCELAPAEFEHAARDNANRNVRMRMGDMVSRSESCVALLGAPAAK
jgi:hypothetical protein